MTQINEHLDFSVYTRQAKARHITKDEMIGRQD